MNYGARGYKRQIDFLLVDEVRSSAMKDADVSDCLSGNSDHRGVLADLQMPIDGVWKQRRRKIRVGWKPNLDENDKPNAYHFAMNAVVGHCGRGVADPTQLTVEAATNCTASMGSKRLQHSEAIVDLFAARRHETDPILRKQLSNKLWKALRLQRRQRTQDEMDKLTAEGAGINKLRRLQQRGAGCERTTGMRDGTGTLKSDPSYIFEVIAQFYEDLYKEGAEDKGAAHDAPDAKFDVEVTVDEVVTALKRLRKLKTGADDGMVAEMLQTGHVGLHEALVTFFTELLRNRLEYPTKWEVAKLSVIFKSGDAGRRITDR